MIAAVYCRKSTEQNVADAAKSITRQVELARAFAEAKGWTVAAEHVYADDAVSGAEFIDRPGLTRLMLAAKSRPRPFGVLVTMDQDRIGRDQVRTLMILNDLVEAGVRVVYYATGHELAFDSPTDQLMVSIRNFGNQWYRHQARAKTREAMRAKAARGHVAGGTVYGYTNVPVEVGGRRSHVDRQINEGEAEVLRRIFDEIAAGRGFTRIAKGLTAEGIPSPRRHQGWAATGVRAMVFNPLYRGVLVYGRTRWTDMHGTKKKVDVPAGEWTTVEVPALRIVSEEAWTAAHRRLDRTRTTYLRRNTGKLWGRPESGIESRYLLTGFLACAVCTGGMSATWTFGARGARYSYYRCSTHRVRGNLLCANGHAVSLPDLDRSVVDEFRDSVLTPARIERVIRRTIELHTADPDDTEGQRRALLAEIRRLDRELAEYTRAIGAGAMSTVLIDTMNATQRRRDDAAARLDLMAQLDRTVETWDRGDLTTEIKARLAEWQDVLAGQPVLGRQILRRLIKGRLAVTPHVDGGRLVEHTWKGYASYGRLLAGTVGQGMVPPG